MQDKTSMSEMDLIADEIEFVKDEEETKDPVLEKVLAEADEKLERLDPIVRETLKDKPEALAEWEDIMRERAEINADKKYAESLAHYEVRPSPIDGRGLFAVRVFEPGEIILRWNTSHLIKRDALSTLPDSERRYLHPFDEDHLMVVQPPERFVNHSCDNNSEVRDFCDVAIRRISPGEEITSNYAADGSESQFDCACGAENCRRKLGQQF